MDIEFLITTMGQWASFIGSITVVGGALIWIYKHLIDQPRERKRAKDSKEMYERMLDIATEKNEPLNQSITSLKEVLSDSIKDRKQLNDRMELNEKRIQQHNHRLKIVEHKNGITTFLYDDDYDLYTEGNEK